MKNPDAKPVMKEMRILLAVLLAGLPFIYSRVLVDPVLVARQLFISAILWCAAVVILLRYRSVLFPLRNLAVVSALSLVLLYVMSLGQTLNPVEGWFTVSKIGLYIAIFLLGVFVFYSQENLFDFVLKCLIFFATVVVASAALDILKLQREGIGIFAESNMYRVTGTFGHKNLLSSITFLCLPFLCAAVVRLSEAWKTAAAILIIFCAGLILLLQTRAVIAGIALSFVITALIALLLFRKGRSQMLVIITGILLLMASFGFVAVKYKEKFSLLTKTESMKERVNLWRNTFEMIREHPATGVGAGNWQVHFPKYGLLKFYSVNYTISEGLTNFQRPHNDFLWVFAETGIVGFTIYILFFLLLLFYLVRLMLREEDVLQKMVYLACFFGVLGYVFIAQVDFPLERMEHQVLLGLLAAYVVSRYVSVFEKEGKKRNSVYVAGFILCAACYALWIGKYRYEGEKHSHKMIVAHGQSNWQKLITEGNLALNPYYNMDAFSIPIKWYIGVGQFTLGDLPAAKRSFEDAYRLHPYQVHVLNNYATSFEKEGNHEKAIELFKEMQRISPLFSDGIINLSGSYFNAGRFEEAFQTMKQFRWDETHPRSHEFMVAIFGKKIEMMMKEDKYSATQKKKMEACYASDSCILQAVKQSQLQQVGFEELVSGKRE